MAITKTAQVHNCDKIWMSQKEAVKYLGVSKDWLGKRREDGKLHYSKVGNTIFYIKKEVDNLVKGGAISGVQIFRKVI